jgi:hypothetical protein
MYLNGSIGYVHKKSRATIHVMAEKLASENYSSHIYGCLKSLRKAVTLPKDLTDKG